MDETLHALIEPLCDSHDLHAGDIPSLDLYMDQIITLISDTYEGNRRAPSEKLLTKTMINNYSKEGLIAPVKGKKYTKEHIMQMLLVYTLKNTLSLQEIKEITKSAYPDADFSLTDAWETALTQRTVQNDALARTIEQLCVTPNFSNGKTGKLASLLAVCALSNTCQRIAQDMVGTYFSPETE